MAMTNEDDGENGLENVSAGQEKDPSMIDIVDVDDIVATARTPSTTTEQALSKLGNATDQQEADQISKDVARSTARGELKPGAVAVQHGDLEAEASLDETVEQSADARAAAERRKKRANRRQTIELVQEVVKHPLPSLESSAETNPPVEPPSHPVKVKADHSTEGDKHKEHTERVFLQDRALAPSMGHGKRPMHDMSDSAAKRKGLRGSREAARQVQALSEIPDGKFGISAAGVSGSGMVTSYLHDKEHTVLATDANGEISVLSTGTVSPGGYDRQLAVASPAEDLVDAEMVDVEREEKIQRQRENRERNRRHCLIALILGSVLLVGLILLVLFLATGESKTFTKDSPAGPPTDAPTTAPTPYIIDLPDYTMLALQDPNSPQSKAYRWLHQDPNWETYDQRTLLERFALATVYYSTDGNNWRHNNNWLSYDVETCEWFFTSTKSGAWKYPCQYSQEGQPYVNLWLVNNKLKGTLPPEIALMPKMNSIQVYGNIDLIGSLPTEIFSLTDLKFLWVEVCEQLTGTIPTEIGLSTNMKNMYISATNIGGTLPTELGRLTAIQDFNVVRSKVTGTLPTELGLWASLKNISLSKTDLVGPFPSEMGMLSNLEAIYASRSQFSGQLPSEFGKLNSIQFLELFEDNLNGTLPTEFGLLSTLEGIWITDNEISGSIPSELGNLHSLEHMLFDNNRFSGDLPSELGNLADTIYQMDVTGNAKLSGLIPGTICSISENLFAYDCSDSFHCARGCSG